jgi:epoxyqueuosine reductase QueG
MDITSLEVKRIAEELGMDLCGVASVDRFEEAPRGYHPRDVLPQCKSVVVIGRKFLHSTLHSPSLIPYSIVRNKLTEKMDYAGLELCYRLEAEGIAAVPAGTVGPCTHDADTNKTRGIISLKHAAVQAGLGKIGKNTLLVNDLYGNMIWLNAVLTSAELEPDPVASYEGCLKNCRLCLDACPIRAMDGVSMDQGRCWQHAFQSYGGDQVVISCCACRKACPNRLGIHSPV